MTREKLNALIGTADIRCEQDSVGRQYLFIRNSEELTDAILALIQSPALPGDLEGLVDKLEDYAASEVAPDTAIRPPPLHVGPYMLREACAEAAQAIRALSADNARLREERDAADLRAGRSERENAGLRESEIKRTSWLVKAKAEAGYDWGVSFDVVWSETLALSRLSARKDKGAEQ